ncbi:MAG: hypothetical protein JRJ60_01165 [Deltaproteobacteria bacterium]|nr:hypothetical protein [Deltaproteobacteria bacterium]
MDVMTPGGETDTQAVDVYLGGEGSNLVESAFTMYRCSPIPTITQWGAFALVLLMGAVAAWFCRKKRRALRS